MFLFGKTREGWLHGEDRAPGARKINHRPRFDTRRRARLRVEGLEDRQLLSWGSVPPAYIAPPANSPPSIYVYPVALSAPGDAQGPNSNVGGEVDFYRFTTPVAGTYLFDATSPGHAVDTVIAVYDASGNRLGYNDDIAPGNHDSETSVTLYAGQQCYLGVTNYITNTTHGSYNWSIDGPAHAAIEFKARALGSGFTGAAVSGLETVPGGYRIRYANCDIYNSPSTGAHEVHGAIRAEYAATANEGDAYGTVVQQILGAPTSDEMDVPGVAGARMNTFEGGAIYWSPGTGAHVVYGGIGAKYNSLGGPSSFLGLPTTDELGMPGGRVSYFQHGWIAWTPGGGAYAG